MMLAGNVNAFIDRGILLVVGDDLANDIAIAQTPDGGISISGTGTTINQGATPVALSRMFRHVTLALGGGDDSVSASNVSVPDHFSFYGGEGDDRLITAQFRARHFHGEGGNGDDAFALGLATRETTWLDLGAGNDTVSANGLEAGRNLKIYAGSGDDTIFSSGLRVKRKLLIDTGLEDDQVLLSDSTNVRNRARVILGDGEDFLAVVPARNSASTHFRLGLEVRAGSGDDNVAVDSAVSVRGRTLLDGGAGSSDAIDRGTSFQLVNFGRLDVRGFENTQVTDLDELIDAVFSRLEEAGLDFNGASRQITVVTASTSLEFSENGASVAVDDSIVLTSSGQPEVSGASIQIESYSAGEETLSFNSAGSIAGSFDNATGRMTLTGNGTIAQYQAALRSIRYVNTSDAPVTDARRFDVSVTSRGQSFAASRNFRVIAVNDAPQVIIEPSGITLALADLPVPIAGALQLTDPDSATIQSAVVTITAGLVPGDDLLAATTNSGIIATYDPSTGALTLAGSASLSQWQTVLRSVTYDQSGAGAAGSRQIRFTVNDGALTSSANVQVTIES